MKVRLGGALCVCVHLLCCVAQGYILYVTKAYVTFPSVLKARKWQPESSLEHIELVRTDKDAR